MSGHREKRSNRQHDPLDVHMADDDEGDSSQLNVVSGRQLRSRKRSAMWQNHLNYLGSSVLAITIKATRLKHTSNGTILGLSGNVPI